MASVSEKRQQLLARGRSNAPSFDIAEFQKMIDDLSEEQGLKVPRLSEQEAPTADSGSSDWSNLAGQWLENNPAMQARLSTYRSGQIAEPPAPTVQPDPRAQVDERAYRERFQESIADFNTAQKAVAYSTYPLQWLMDTVPGRFVDQASLGAAKYIMGDPEYEGAGREGTESETADKVAQAIGGFAAPVAMMMMHGQPIGQAVQQTAAFNPALHNMNPYALSAIRGVGTGLATMGTRDALSSEFDPTWRDYASSAAWMGIAPLVAGPVAGQIDKLGLNLGSKALLHPVVQQGIAGTAAGGAASLATLPFQEERGGIWDIAKKVGIDAATMGVAYGVSTALQPGVFRKPTEELKRTLDEAEALRQAHNKIQPNGRSEEAIQAAADARNNVREQMLEKLNEAHRYAVRSGLTNMGAKEWRGVWESNLPKTEFDPSQWQAASGTQPSGEQAQAILQIRAPGQTVSAQPAQTAPTTRVAYPGQPPQPEAPQPSTVIVPPQSGQASIPTPFERGALVTDPRGTEFTVIAEDGNSLIVESNSGTLTRLGKNVAKPVGGATSGAEPAEILPEPIISAVETGVPEQTLVAEEPFVETPVMDSQPELPDNIAYHAGDLGKAEGLSSMETTRGTGHFGTGTYFVGNTKDLDYEEYRGRPLHRVDLSGYNLYPARDRVQGFELHQFLKGVNKIALGGGEDIALKDMKRRAERLFRDYDASTLEQTLSELKQYVADNPEPWRTRLQGGPILDTPSTLFMKQLGYEGVDTRGIPELDNIEFGTVVYDLKQPSAQEPTPVAGTLTTELVRPEAPSTPTIEMGSQQTEEEQPATIDTEVGQTPADTRQALESTPVDSRTELSDSPLVPVDPDTVQPGDTIYDPAGTQFEVIGSEGDSFRVKLPSGSERPLRKELARVRERTDGVAPATPSAVVVSPEEGTPGFRGTLQRAYDAGVANAQLPKELWGDGAASFAYALGRNQKHLPLDQIHPIGSRVKYTNSNGDEVTGTIESYADYAKAGGYIARVRVDQPVLAGGVPIEGSNAVPIFRLELIESATPSVEPAQPQAQPEVSTTPPGQIASFVKDQLTRGEKFDSKALIGVAEEAYGGSMAEGTFDRKDAYDAMELGINQYLLDNVVLSSTNVPLRQAIQNVSELNDRILGLVPTQTVRTTEQEQFQQYSTPPTLGYVAAWLTNMNSNDVVLEPSAGIGGLALFGKSAGAEVIVNELSTRRAEILREMGFDQLYTENAEQLHNILPDNVKPSVVIMNPPFSATAGRTNKNKTSNATLHLEQALKRLEPNGRLVAIVGRGMADDAPAFRKWWNSIKEDYSVLANVGVDGKNYTKYGTSFDNRILVIDKTGPTVDPVIAGNFSDLGELMTSLEGVRNERLEYKPTESSPGQPDGETAIETGQGGPESGVIIPATTDPLGTGRKQIGGTGLDQQPGDRGFVGDGGDVDVQQGPTTDHEHIDQSRSELGTEVDSSQRGEVTQETGGSSPVSSGEVETSTRGTRSSGGLELEQVKPTQQSGTDLGDAVFAAYTPSKVQVRGAKEHPGVLAESAAMSAVEPPTPTYQPQLPEEVVREGKLSNAQLESIVYAGQAHQQTLPNGETKGFFIGDGTGVGKGREIAGIILDNMQQGRKKAVWVSKNAPLYNDAVRDASDVGIDPNLVFDFGKIKLGETIQQGEGILFTTYNTLAVGLEASRDGEVIPKGDKGARMDQLVKWLGKDFDGVIMFDEAHEMQNSVAQKGKRGMKKPAVKALAGVELQKRLPEAKVVYVSATGASDVSNLAYARRLGLWGEGTPFADVNDFITKISEGGLAALEVVARDMKAMGLYLARSLSYDGVDYSTLEHSLSPDQAVIFDEMAKGWQIVLQNIEEALRETGAIESGQARGRARSQFWGTHQRFFNQILTSMQMPSVLESIDQDLADGKAVVLQLVNTNQAVQERRLAQLEEGDALEELDLTPRDMLMQFLEKGFPVHQYETYTDEEGNTRSRLVVDSQGNPVINKDAEAKRDALLDRLGSMRVPEGPLEMLINRFGSDNVAEITGRSRRVVKTTDSQGRETAKIEKRSARHIKADADAFMDDRKKILVFSDAGGTGRSYHADLTAKNQRQRKHYLIQAGWRAENAVQGFGRTHRTNQASAPEYVLVTTNLKGQKRFISSIARRLDQLGALTKGQRQTGSQGLFSASDNLESSIAKDALERFYSDLVSGRIEGLDAKDLLGKMGLDNMLDQYGNLLETMDRRDITKWLNRLLSLESGLQNRVFDEFSDRMDALVEAAMVDGTLDMGLENYHADSISVAEENVVYVDEGSGAETKYVALDTKHKTTPVTFENVDRKYRLDRHKNRVELNQKDPNYKGILHNTQSKRVYGYFDAGTHTMASGRVAERYRLLDQSGNVRYLNKYDIQRGNWETLTDKTQAKQLWDEALKNIPEFKDEKVHLITGALLPIWDRLPQGNVRVFRIMTDDGQMMLGRVVPEDSIDHALARLGASRTREEVDAGETVGRILNDGYTARLANGWNISRRLVSGEHRLEIGGEDLYKYADEFSRLGVFSERINYQTRYFIPTGERSGEIFEAITKHRPVVDVVAPGRALEGMPSDAEADSFDGGTDEPSAVEEGPEVEPVKRMEIVQALRELATIREKRLRSSRKNRGEFNPRTEVIRVKNVEDISTLAHEYGHALRQIWGVEAERYPELLALGERLYAAEKDKMSRAQLGSEGFAEFMRYWFQAPELLESRSPDFLQEFNALLDEDQELNEALLNVQDLYLRWKELSPEQRVAGKIITDLDTTKPKQLMSKVERTYSNWVDDVHLLFKIMDMATDETLMSEWDVEIDRNPYILARLARASGSLSHTMIHGRGFDPERNLTGKSLAEILEPIADDIENFRTWLVAKRAEGLHSVDRRSGFDPTEIDITVSRLENDTFLNAQQELEAYQDNLLDFLVDAEIIAQEQKDSWKENNPYYVPFYRFFDENYRFTGRGGSKKYADLRNPIKGLKGSDRSVIDPLESIIKNTYAFMQLSANNKVGLAIAELASVEGNGWIIEEVPPPQTATRVNLKDFKRELMQAGLEKEEIEMLDLDQMASVFRPKKHAGFGESRENILTIFQNGSPRFYQVHPELYEVMTNISPAQAPSLLRFLRPFTRVKRTLATFSPNFLVRNAPRDAMSAQFYSRYGSIPIIDTLKGLSHVIKRDDMYYSWLASGGGMSTMVSMDRNYLRKDLRKIMESNAKKSPAQKIASGWEWFLDAVQATEEATRVGVYERGLKVETKQRGEENREGRLRAAYASREGTIDFARGGKMSRQVNQFVAFFNVGIQGTDQTMRYIKRQMRTNPVGFMAKAFTLVTLPSLLLFLINKDNDEYWELPEWRRDTYWNFPLGDGKWFHFPKPFELGVLFGSIPERFFEWVNTRDPSAFDGLGDTMLDGFTPVSNVWDLIPDAFLPILEVTSNYYAWQDRPIEGMADERLPQSERYGIWTSETAKKLGELFNYSPKRIDHLINGYGAGASKFVVNWLDLLTEEGRAKADPMELIPGASAFVSDAYRSSASVNNFYDEIEEWERDRPKHAYTKQLRSTRTQLDNIRKEIESVTNSRMSPGVKRDRVNVLNRRRAMLAKQVLNRKPSRY